MGNRILHIAISPLTGFITLTAIGGGIALLVRLEAARIPLAWLKGTLFRDYVHSRSVAGSCRGW